MVRFLYIIAAIFLVTWAIGFFFYSLGAIIHLFLVLAIVIVLIRYFNRRDRIRRARSEARSESIRRERNV